METNGVTTPGVCLVTQYHSGHHQLHLPGCSELGAAELRSESGAEERALGQRKPSKSSLGGAGAGCLQRAQGSQEGRMWLEVDKERGGCR